MYKRGWGHSDVDSFDPHQTASMNSVYGHGAHGGPGNLIWNKVSFTKARNLLLPLTWFRGA